MRMGTDDDDVTTEGGCDAHPVGKEPIQASI